MARIETWFEQDLQKPVSVRVLKGNLFSMDNQGNLIGVKVLDGGEAATLSGTVSGNVIRQDGGTVAVSGTLSGNQASIVLPQAAYAVPGLIIITIKLTSGSVVTTLAALTAVVYRTSTDVAVDPGTLISDINALIAAIDTAVASIPADYSSLWTSLAPAFSTSTAYVAGQYVTYNGGFYRFTTAHAAGSWNSSHVVACNLGGEVTDLKSALEYVDGTLLEEETEIKYSTTQNTSIQIASGEAVTNQGWYATPLLFVPKNVVSLKTDFYGGSTFNGGAWYDDDGVFISNSGFLLNSSGAKTISKPTGAKYVRLSQNSGGTYIKYVTSDSLEQLRTDTANEIEQESKEFHNLTNSLYSDVNAEYKLISGESVNVSTGAFVSNPGWYRTGFIEIPINVSKISTDFYGGSSVNGYAWYNSDKNYISGNVLNFSGEKVLTPPTNAKYIVLSENTEGNHVKFLSQNTLKNVLDVRENGGITILPSVWGANQSVQIATGNVVSNQGFYRFPMTEIPVGAKFLITNCTATSTANGFAFYDSTGAYISGALINFPDGWYTTIVIPKNAKFVAGCDNSGNHATRTLAFAFNNLYGRSLYSDGDSIAAGVGNNGRNYATIIAEKYGMRLNDQAVGGGTLAINTYDFTDPTQPEHWISNSVPTNMTTQYDYAIIEGGFNDEGHNVPIGALSSDPDVPLTANPDKTTMVGALESIFQYIMKNYPKTKIFFLCVHRIYKYQTLPRYQGGQSYGVYLEKARECCARYGVEVIDVFNESNLNTYIDIMSQKYMYENDRTHPNEDGYQYFYVPLVEKHMLID